MEWFCFGIDPVIDLLDRILTGMLIVSLPVFGPSLPPPAPIIQKYTVQGYCYDLKPAITSIQQQVQVPPSGKMARSAHAGRYTGELLHAL